MSDAIRDVLIRVGIVNGNLTVGGLDTRAFDESLMSATARWHEFRRTVSTPVAISARNAILPDAKIGLDTPSLRPDSSVFNESLRPSVADIVSSEQQRRDVHSSSHWSDASESARKYMSVLEEMRNEMRRTEAAADAMLSAMSGARSADVTNAWKKRLDTVEEYTKSVHNAAAATEWWTKNREAASKIWSPAKVLAEEAYDAKISRAGLSQRGLGAVNWMRDWHLNATQQIADFQGPPPGDDTALSRMSLFRFSGSMVPSAVGGAALGYMLKSWNDRQNDYLNESQRYRIDQGGEAVRAAAYTSSIANSRTRSVLDYVRESPSLVAAKHTMRNIEGDERMEADLRTFEATDVDPRFKAVRRQLAEYANPRQQILDQVPEQIEDRQRRIDRIDGELEDLKRLRIDRAGQHRNAVRSYIDVAEHAFDETSTGFTMRQIRKPLAWTGLLGGHNVDTGFYEDQHQAQKQAFADREQATNQFRKDEVAFAEQEKQLLHEKTQLQNQVVDIKLRELTVTRELQQSVYNAVRNETERVRSLQIAYGSSSIMQQNSVKRLNQKADAITAKRADNIAKGLPEDQNLPEFTQHEMGQDPMGSKAKVEMDRQAIRKAKGDKFEVDSNLRDLEQVYDKIKNVPTQPMVNAIGEGIDNWVVATQELNAKLDQIVRATETMALSSRKLDEILANLNQYKMKAQGR